MVVAELEAFFSRPVAPTRRIAIGRFHLREPRCSPAATSAAAMLIGGVLAGFAANLDDDDIGGLQRLIDDVDDGRRIPQPRMRHRLQVDRVGLKRSTNHLVADPGGRLRLRLDRTNGTCSQHALAAIYSAARLDGDQRRDVCAAMRVGLQWAGPPGEELLAVLAGGHTVQASGFGLIGGDPVHWALQVLELANLDGRPARREVQRAFRSALHHVHPDHGAPLNGAAARISELDTARRILLG